MRIFFRVVRQNPPGEDDFKSHLELGRNPPDLDPETLDNWAGLSVHETEAQSRANVHFWRQKRGRNLGDYIAELRIPDDVEVRDKPGKDGHHNLYAAAAVFAACVHRVIPV